MPFGASRAGLMSVAEDDIPDIGLDHLWWGPSMKTADTYPDVEGALDMSAVESPQLSDINDRQAADYDGSNDAHTVSSSPSLGDNDAWTMVVVYDLADDGSANVAFDLGSNGSDFGGYEFNVRFDNDEYQMGHTGVDSVRGGSPSEGPEIAVATYDGSEMILDINKTEIARGSVQGPNAPQNQTDIGRRGDNDQHTNGLIGAVGHEAAAADSSRRDELTDIMADEFNIDLS